MNANHIEQPIVDLAEKLPKYCNYYKHLLVEELVLEADFRQLHYGKCAVIGRLCAIPDHFKLENVTVPHLPSDCKLPTGAVSVLLLNFNYDAAGDTSLAHGNYCVVRGEVVLCNVEQPNSELLTIRGLYEHLLLLSDDNKERDAFLETLQRTHKPALNVWHARRIDLAEELLQSRLELFVQTGSIDSCVQQAHLEQSKDAAWLEFWQREGHELLEQKWHKTHPDYKQEIEEATNEQRENWETLWQQHASQLSAHFWHIFTCAFENYANDLSNGLRNIDEVLDNVDEYFTDLNIHQDPDSANSSESDVEQDESYLTANDDPDICDEQQQLKLLGLPTSFGTKVTQKKRRIKPKFKSESDSESDSNQLEMSKDADKEAELHAVQSRNIKKKKRKRESKIPESLRNNNTMLKYWFKRFSLFSLFDRGIRLDDESWFSVTPEKIAKQIAQRLASDIVVDAFCGCGGNAIQFAKTCRRVIAIDIDVNKLAMAKHNAAIYGVADKIEFIHADFLHFASSTRLRADVVFLSPPWGGPNYQKSVFDIEEHLLPVGASQLMQYARRLSDNIGIYLPRSSSIKQVVALSNVGQQCEVEHSYLDTRLVAITAYFGNVIKTEPQHSKQEE